MDEEPHAPGAALGRRRRQLTGFVAHRGHAELGSTRTRIAARSLPRDAAADYWSN